MFADRSAGGKSSANKWDLAAHILSVKGSSIVVRPESGSVRYESAFFASKLSGTMLKQWLSSSQSSRSATSTRMQYSDCMIHLHLQREHTRCSTARLTIKHHRSTHTERVLRGKARALLAVEKLPVRTTARLWHRFAHRIPRHGRHADEAKRRSQEAF